MSPSTPAAAGHERQEFCSEICFDQLSESENRRWSTIGSDEWLLNTIVLRNSFLAGPFTDRAPVAALRPQMNSLTRLSPGLAIQIHGWERRGKRGRDLRNSSHIVEPY
jgi:hypothetical protein